MSYGSLGAWKNDLIRNNGGETSGSRSTVGRETADGVETTCQVETPGDRVGDEESSWKLVKKRKTKGKNAVLAAGSEKDPQAVTDTKAKRTFLEVALGDDPVLGKKKERDMLEKQTIKDSRPTMFQKLVETTEEDDTINDFRDAVKPRRSQALLESRPKPRSSSERKIGSLSGKAGLKKAELVLKESLGLLDGKRVLLAKMTAELFQNTDASARMDTDVSMDELEKKELELLRKFASACKQNQFGESENEV